MVAALVVAAFAYIGLLAYPQPLFAHQIVDGNFTVWSDRPIDPAIAEVLDDVRFRLETSELYDETQRFRVFLCNEDWRLRLLGQRFNASLGGVADGWFARHIFIRESVIAENRLVSPSGGPMLDAEVRTLSYYIAHEAAHILEARAFGRVMAIWHPQWLWEGYADYVAKGGDFDFDLNRGLLINDHSHLDYERSGLYRRFHLQVALLLDKKGLDVRDVFAAPPDEAELLAELRSGAALE